MPTGSPAFSEHAVALAPPEPTREVAREHVQLARELVALELAGDPGRRTLVQWAIVALLRSQEEGGTRVAVASHEAATVFGPLLARAGVGEAQQPAALVALEEATRPAGAGGLIGEPDDHVPLIRVGDHLYSHRMYWREVELCAALRQMLQERRPLAGTSELAAALDELVLTGAPGAGAPQAAASSLSDEQQAAVLAAMHAHLCLISGGPGTGKTSILLSVVRLATMLGLSPKRIALAAPTGKAARRAREALDTQLASRGVPPLERRLIKLVPPARTLHRLLGYDPERGFRHDALNPLPFDLVIVDEASMLDLGLAVHLVRALESSSRLVLVGDADQLPPVGSGAVFRSLVPAGDGEESAALEGVEEEGTEQLASEASQPPLVATGHVVRLTHSFRMREDDEHGSHVLSVAQRVRSGDLGLLTDIDAGTAVFHRRRSPDALQFAGVELCQPTPTHVEKATRRWAREKLFETFRLLHHSVFRLRGGAFDAAAASTIRAAMRAYDDVSILCATRHGARGTRALNQSVTQRLAEALGRFSLPEMVPGTPVMVLRNDYRRNLFNGDTGVVASLRVEDDDTARPMAVFSRGDGLVAFDTHALRAMVDVAFATTIHKSQGSEFEVTMVVLPERDQPLLSRELLYTAVTRSRRGVAILAEDNVLASCIERTQTASTGLARVHDSIGG